VEIVADSSPRPGDPEVLVGDSTKLRKGLGWEPEIPLATSLVDTLDSYRARTREDLSEGTDHGHHWLRRQSPG
jgi:nucleoside-diphosphate-sugar epimerase